MNSKILVAGFACLSLVAMAQSTSGNKSNSTKANGHAPSAQSAAKPAPAGKSADRESSTPSVSEVTLKAHAQGREGSAPSVSEAVVKAPSNAQTHVAAGDLNGDGHADVTATSASTNHGQKPAGTGNTSVRAPRDAASGQASGKRQHKPIQVRKEVDAATP